MWIECKCGKKIHDNTDYQENKAYIIPDQDMEGMLEELDGSGCPWEITRKYTRHIFQCHECGRIYIKNQNGEFESFKPDGEPGFGILKSI